MQFSKVLLVLSAAFAPFAFAEDSPTKTLTIQVVHLTTSTSPSSSAFSVHTPSSSARVSSTPLFSKTPSPTPSVTPSSYIVPQATGGAPAIKLSNAMAAGVVAAAGFVML
ncbi:hypothetical protein ETB97_009967 [Aspergillus alliaceus]|uniref:Uncharacterized protein n=1 Tax=Petromyces alliaceus TaxID=209559 RepID=A0A5N6FGU0_PETAA|nr:uncharacterized protein BDW43DRAFT_292212 [Aspergillus alliaceus]KAB8228100.1 hypothetical protein BDW43DRAFT_292212 [Aspergillus alliaceus]KAE8387185.1 hypothetical protein BDV23DRAFT_161651 [Aspergillus alliaceus]KAF5866808.1 hypothetical protein ETB97_009967 [Aspergillus burnettii]